MKAVIINRFGASDVLEINNNLPQPVVNDNQVMVNVKAAGVNPLDWKIRKGMLRMILGANFPMVLGNDAAGVIVKCGRRVKDFKVGDNVYCMLDPSKKPSFFGFAKTGSYAEYAVTREDTLSLMPKTLSYEEAASIPLCGLTAYQVLVNKVKLEKGSKILINGASGGVGVFATQIAKALGAEVTAVCGTKNVELMKKLGADRVIDYTKHNFLELPDKYDVCYDIVVGITYRESKKVLTDNGVYISNLASPIFVFLPFLRRVKLFKKRTFAWVEPCGEDLQRISEMINKGQIRPVIDKVFSIDEVRSAHEHSENGKVAGKIVLKL